MSRPLLPIYLSKDKETKSPFYALVDSGAEGIILQNEIAEYIGVGDITAGKLSPTQGIGGHIEKVFYHNGIKLRVLGENRILEVPEIGFFEGPSPISILGRVFFSFYKTVSFEEEKEMFLLETPS